MQTRTDKELLVAYAGAQDESAFAELVTRYQSLVYQTCYRLLRDVHEAEDATQATFVVLARKAGGLRREGRLNGWLHRVARHVGLHALERRMDRQRQRERHAQWQEGVNLDAGNGPDVEGVLREIDRELDSLSAILRNAVILRYLRGFSEKDAAAYEGCPLGTMKRRSSDGIATLRARLARRGVTLGAMALVGVLESEAQAAIPETLLSSVITSVKTDATGTGGASGSAVVSLSNLALRAMFWAKVKTVAAIAAGVVLVGVGGYQLCRLAMSEKAVAPVAAATTAPVMPVAKVEKVYRLWTFKDGPPEGFKIVEGDWRWQKGKDGVGRMIPCGEVAMGGRKYRNSVVFVLPVETPPRPMLVRMMAESIGGTGGSCVQWDVSGGMFSAATADKAVSYSTGTFCTLRYFLFGRYSFSLREDGSSSSVDGYDKAFPAKDIRITLSGVGLLKELELREPSEEELKKATEVLKRKLGENVAK